MTPARRDPWDDESEASAPPPPPKPRLMSNAPPRGELPPVEAYEDEVDAPPPARLERSPSATNSFKETSVRPSYRAPKPYVSSGGKQKGPPPELYITAFRKGSDEQEKISFGLSIAAPGYAKWGLDTRYWYNLSFWFNLDQLQDFFNSNVEIAKNIGRGRMYEPKVKEARH